MTALRKTPVALTPTPLRSRSVRSVPRTSLRVKRCSMPALATTAIRAPASACATDARPPKASPSRPCARAGWSGTLRLWHVSAGGVPALMLGPLAVDAVVPQARRRRRADGPRAGGRQARGHGAVILLGDAPYYARFGFSAAQDRRAVAARPVRARPPARPRTARRRARRRLGHDRADRRRRERARRARKALRPCRARPERHHAGSPPSTPRVPLRSVITTILLLMISVMIVRDIFAAGAPPRRRLRRDTALVARAVARDGRSQTA